jgi:hypothetical protein
MMKNVSVRNDSLWTVALSFVIPSEAEGSAVSADLSWKRGTSTSLRIVISTGAERSAVSLPPLLLRSRLHRNHLLMDTSFDFGDRAIVDRHFLRLSLQHKAMAYL